MRLGLWMVSAASVEMAQGGRSVCMSAPAAMVAYQRVCVPVLACLCVCSVVCSAFAAASRAPLFALIDGSTSPNTS